MKTITKTTLQNEDQKQWRNFKKDKPPLPGYISIRCKCEECGEQTAFFLGNFTLIPDPHACAEHGLKETKCQSMERMRDTITEWKTIN